MDKKRPVSLNNKTILITGSAGFIGANLVISLLRNLAGGTIVSLDDMNDYYDPALKDYRLARINELAAASQAEHIFVKGSVADRGLVNGLFEDYSFDIVVNLAAQAGVRHSIDSPDAYIETNILGFYNILEACRHSYDSGCKGVEHLVFASSSSVYGSRRNVPFTEGDRVDRPVSLYAATKASDELMAYAYSKIYDIPATGLRFFTVYGPAGRPDMAYFSFTKRLLSGESIQVYNEGNCLRDFTYVDDIVEGIIRVMQGAPEKEESAKEPPYALYNIGFGSPVSLLEYIHILTEELITAGLLPEDYDISSHIELKPMQPGDVPVTYADTKKLERDYNYRPRTTIREGLRRFVEWYGEYYFDGAS